MASYGVIGNMHLLMGICIGNKYIPVQTQMFLSYYFFFISTSNCPLVRHGEIENFLQNSCIEKAESGAYITDRRSRVVLVRKASLAC